MRLCILRTRLYKYKTFNCEKVDSLDRARDIFHKNELYFSSPSDFNDPFDCLVHLDFKRIKKDEFWRYYDNVLARKTNLTQQERKESFETAYASKEIENIFVHSLQNSFNSRGVYSLSSKNDDILMWSHYSDGHRGYCFELDELKIEAQKVKYKKRFPKFNLFGNDMLLKILLFTKPLPWKYEREWRYFSKESGPIKINNNSIKSVIFGSQMDEKNRKSLLEIVERGNHHPNIFEAIINSDTYSVSIEKYKI